MDVADWLRSLGLEQYEAAFRENAVDAEVLPRLTAVDFKEMDRPDWPPSAPAGGDRRAALSDRTGGACQPGFTLSASRSE